MKTGAGLLFTILFFLLIGGVTHGTMAVWSELGMTLLWDEEGDTVTYYGKNGEQHRTKLNGQVIVLDAGHGGRDPGKVGTLGTKEAEINLAIVYKLRDILSHDGYLVVLTRQDGEGLYDATDSGKKLADMKKRVEIAEAAKPICVLSIHQNSYPSESVSGAQSFYYSSSAESKQLAETIQEELLGMDPTNHRSAKANGEYYILKKCAVPVVLVECGFLSCPREEELLITEEYQWTIAHAIAAGVHRMYGENEKAPSPN